MKKVTFMLSMLIGSFAMGYTVDSDLTAMGMTDPNFIDAMGPYSDDNGDLVITLAEANALVGNVYLNNEGISDLTGIGAFPNISHLAVGDNMLTSLDLSDNTNLYSVYCANNSITAITIPVSRGLQSIDASNNNLVVLDLSDCDLLKNVSVTNNQLTCLNVKVGNNIASGLALYAEGNHLTEIKADAGYTSTYIDAGVIFNPASVISCEPCVASTLANITSPVSSSFTGTYPIINVANATAETQVRISTSVTFTSFQMVPQSAGFINKFPTQSLNLCHDKTYHIQVRDNSCSPWIDLTSFDIRDYSKQWADNLSDDIATPKVREINEYLVSTLPGTDVDRLEWYIEDVSSPGNLLPPSTYTDYSPTGLSFRYFKLDATVVPLLEDGHVYRVIVKGIATGTPCGTINDYPLAPDGGSRYPETYFVYVVTPDAPPVQEGGNGFGYASKLSVYPNPTANGEFTLTTEGFDVEKEVTIMSFDGKVITEMVLKNNQMIVDLSHCAKGVYFVSVNDGEKQEISRVVLK